MDSSSNAYGITDQHEVHPKTSAKLNAVRYYYVVGPSSNPSQEFTFLSAPGPSDQIYNYSTFAVVADMGTVIPAGWY